MDCWMIEYWPGSPFCLNCCASPRDTKPAIMVCDWLSIIRYGRETCMLTSIKSNQNQTMHDGWMVQRLQRKSAHRKCILSFWRLLRVGWLGPKPPCLVLIIQILCGHNMTVRTADIIPSADKIMAINSERVTSAEKWFAGVVFVVQHVISLVSRCVCCDDWTLTQNPILSNTLRFSQLFVVLLRHNLLLPQAV